MLLDQTHVIAVSNQKGGCGKTTTTVNLAGALAERGYMVAVVDNDEQRNATSGLGLDVADHLAKGLYTVLDAHLKQRPMTEIITGFEETEDRPARENLVLAPAHRELGAVENANKAELEGYLSSERASDLDGDDMRAMQRLRLRKSIDKLRGVADIVLIDCPPNLRHLMTTALIAADHYLIPVLPTTFDLEGLGELTNTVNKVRKRYNTNLSLLGALLCGVSLSAEDTFRVNLDRELYDQMKADLGEEHVFRRVMSPTVKLREAFAFGKTIIEYDPQCRERITEQYLQLADEVVERVGGRTKKEATPKTEPLQASAETVNTAAQEVANA